jgi:hypothetical protein
MAASFVAYIDESGDEGFKFLRDGSGSSRWFVMAAALTRKVVDVQTVKLVDGVRQALRYDARRVLHFSKMKHEHRIPYIDAVARARLRIVVVAIHKPSLQEPETFQRNGLLYRFAARLLLERLSWCCRDHRIDGEGDGSAEVVFSNRSGTSYKDMRDYFALLEKQSDVGEVRIDWSVVRPERVSAVNHDASMGLQIADAVASAFFLGVQLNHLGYCEPRYATILKPVVYGFKGRKMGNGLKLWPGELAELAAACPEVRWIADTYR